LHEQNGDVAVASLKQMFNKILNLVPNYLRLLCDITSGRKNKWVPCNARAHGAWNCCSVFCDI